MPGKSDRTEPGDWNTPAGFEAFQDRALAFQLGATNFQIGSAQFHIHEINSVTRAHAHSDYQIIYYLKGSGAQVIGEDRYPVKSQTIFYIPPNMLHNFHPDPGVVAVAFTLQFSMDLEPDMKRQEEDWDYRRLAKMLYDNRLRCIGLTPEETSEAEEMIEKTRDELTLKSFGYALAVKGNILLLLRLFLRAGVRKDHSEKPMTRAQLVFLRATTYIRRNMASAISLPEVAGFCNVSTSYLQKLFRQNLGMPFSRHVQEVKVNHASHLLRTTDLSVKEIANECGIPDRNYFTRLFRKIQGESPREFRD
ncbi:MAG: AraC family transcriptional regulator [Planctomycetes bacterium]|nr:AraC family transcriptional regulator [Planctomycetota bacterium]